MTALVTGANGFVGQHLVERLRRDGVRVRALVRPGKVARLPRAPDEIVQGDLTDPASLRAAVRGCDVVYHLAVAHGPHVTWPECVAVNVEGTRHLAHEAARAGVGRFVYASTRGVYGPIRSGMKLNERTPPSPDTAYRRSKVMAEQLLTDQCARGGVPVVIVRLPSMLGAGAMSWRRLFRAIASGGFRMIGSGRNRFHPCHIADAVEGLVSAGNADGVDGECYLLGGAQPVSVAEFLEAVAHELKAELSRIRLPAAPYVLVDRVERSLARLTGRPARHAHYEMFLSSYEIDHAKASRELGYAPSHSLADAIHQSADWYRAQAHL